VLSPAPEKQWGCGAAVPEILNQAAQQSSKTQNPDINPKTRQHRIPAALVKYPG